MHLTRLHLILLGVAGSLLAYLILARPSTKESSMTSIPGNDNPAFIRTDFSNDDVWKGIRAAAMTIPSDVRKGIEVMIAMNTAIGADVSGCKGSLEFVHIIDDSRYKEQTTEQVLELFAKDAENACLFIADHRTISDPDHPILVVDLLHQRGRTFRTIPSEVQGIASNLSIANMDWEDFADNADSDGVFRGFPQSDR
jgi:hypothetical protein